jgi:hypothetical protein
MDGEMETVSINQKKMFGIHIETTSEYLSQSYDRELQRQRCKKLQRHE